VAVSWSRTVSGSTVTLSRRTSGVEERSVVTKVCSTWAITLQDTARVRVLPSLTKTDDDPGNFGELWFNDHDKQIITHFLSSNPDESGMASATWQHSRDTSTVWAMAIASSSDPNFVELGAIPWLLLQVVGTEPGPTGGERSR
jgi:hypothetical protein